jgi:hypothetical protein
MHSLLLLSKTRQIRYLGSARELDNFLIIIALFVVRSSMRRSEFAPGAMQSLSVCRFVRLLFDLLLNLIVFFLEDMFSW